MEGLQTGVINFTLVINEISTYNENNNFIEMMGGINDNGK
jgi:hypothetical protein